MSTQHTAGPREPDLVFANGRIVVKHDERRRSLQYSVHVDGAVLCGGRGNRYFGTAVAAMDAGQRRLSRLLGLPK